MTFHKVLAALLVVASLAMATVFIYVASRRELSTLELVTFQLMTLFLSLAGSFVGGRQFADASSEQSLRRHAKSAFRRVLSLYRGLSRVAALVAEKGVAPQNVLPVIEAVVKEQIDTADDALEDWREIVPEDAEALQKAIHARSLGENNATR